MDQHLLQTERLHAMDELEIRYRTSERQKKLTLAENKNLIQSQQLAQQKWIITLLTLGLLSTLLTVRNFVQKRRVARLKLELKHQQELDRAEKEKDLAAMQALFFGQEQERQRIATDLHDGLGGSLYALQLQLTSNGAPDEHLQTLRKAITESRRISKNLMPPTLSQVGLGAAIQEWSLEFQNTWSIPVNLYLEAESFDLPEQTRTSLYRITQELMNNAARHAKANQISVQFHKTADSFQLMIEDDGQGFDLASTDRFFLKTVASRTRLLHAKLRVDSSVGHGTTIILEGPVNLTESKPLEGSNKLTPEV